jgi:hypothetical protein
MNFLLEEYDAVESTSALRGGQDGEKHIIQHMYGADLEYTKGNTSF